MNKKKGIALVIIVLFCTVVTLMVAGKFKTVAQQEAEASPPPASVMTTQVSNQKFSDSIPVQCSLGYEVATALQPTGELPANAQYTKIAVVDGEELNQGSLIAEINGNPVFFGVGPFAFYRDLYLDDTGPDAKMLNDILAELGYQYRRYGAEASTFDETTAEALAALYRSFNYPAPQKDAGFKASSFVIMSEPQKIISPPRTTGAVATAPIAQISGSQQQLTCKGLTGELSPEIILGMPLVLHSQQEEIRTTITGFTGSLSEKTDEKSDGNQQVSSAQSQTTSDKKILASKPDNLPETATNLSAEVILSESSGELPVVPASALWSQQGQTFVTVLNGQTETDIPVTILYSAGGFNEVQPLSGTLTVGDEIKLATGGQ